MKKQLLITFLIFFSLQSFAQWSNDPAVNTLVSNETNSKSYRSSTQDGAGGVISVWSENAVENINTQRDLYVQRLSDAGFKLWGTNGINLTNNTINDIRYPEIVTDNNGGAIIVWVDETSTNTGTITAQRISANGVKLWGNNGIILGSDILENIYFRIKEDGFGGLILLYTSNNQILAQRLSANSVKQWGSNGVVISDSPTTYIYPSEIYAVGTGFSFLFDYEYLISATEEGYRLVSQGLNSNGTRSTPLNTLLYDVPENAIRQPVDFVPDGNGGFYFAIVEDDDITAKLYLQHHLANGSTTYPGLGILVDESIGKQINEINNSYFSYEIKMETDNAGGVVLSWSDMRSNNYGLYAQRYNINGTKLWNANDVTVIPALLDNAEDLKINQNGEFVFFVTKKNQNETGNLLFVQKVSADGVRQYKASGILAASYNSYKNGELVVTGDKAVLVWGEYRAGNTNIYAQSIFANGTLPVTFADFTAEFKNQKTTLKWVTASESINKHFSVERSQDGFNFTSIGIINGEGTTAETNYYNFYDIDAFAKTGVLYYRIKQVDFDGNSDYTEIKAVNVGSLSASNQITCYPNPVTNGELNITAGNEAIKSVTLINLSGVKVISIPKVSNPKAVVVNTQGLTKGVYLLEITNAQSTTVKKVIID